MKRMSFLTVPWCITLLSQLVPKLNQKLYYFGIHPDRSRKKTKKLANRIIFNYVLFKEARRKHDCERIFSVTSSTILVGGKKEKRKENERQLLHFPQKVLQFLPVG